MDQFRYVGEVLGGLRALVLLQEDSQINHRQCCLLLDIFTLAFSTIAEEIKLSLKLEEKARKWKALEHPLRELARVFKEGEMYVRQCMDKRDWWLKAIYLHKNKDCVEFHIHNLLTYFPTVIESIETAGEIAGLDQNEMQKKRIALARKYDKEWNDPKLFEWRFGKQYLVPQEIRSRFESAWREDRWKLAEALKERKSLENATKIEQRLADLLLHKVIGSEKSSKLYPSSILYEADYLVRRRLGGQYKEIQWLGDNFLLRHFFGELETSSSEVSVLLSLAHPNISQYLCGFHDEEKKEILLIIEMMNKDLYTYMKENCGPRRRILFALPVAVDIMLQIARGMEFLHSQKIYHGELTPSNVFLKSRIQTEGYFYVKVSGFGLTSVRNSAQNSTQNQIEANSCVWYAPEVLAELEEHESTSDVKYTEKADVYSFGMICFQLLTGKVPFEDAHLQGEKPSRNIRLGERPLFPYTAPKYLVNLTKRCWHEDPAVRPSFSSICRILRYVKKFLVMNPDYDQPEMQLPAVEYSDVETWFLRKFAGVESIADTSVSQIPFQMFAYRLAEKDKTIMSDKDKDGELTGEAASTIRDESVSIIEDPFATGSDTKSVASDVRSVCSDVKSVWSDVRSVCSEIPERRSIYREIPTRRSMFSKIPEKRMVATKKATDAKTKKSPEMVKARPVPTKPSTVNKSGRSVSLNRGARVTSGVSPMTAGRRRQSSGHISE